MEDNLYITKVITLRPGEIRLVDEYNQDHNLDNFSLSIRKIILEWAELTGRPLPSPTNGNGHNEKDPQE